MAIRITLECGHASMLRVRTTPQGYTHDWEVFVRGIDNADIHHYVEKVVFQLHETFSKPKRVVKEPPFVIKESGYAGFEIPIHIYLKNKDEGTKKIEILYDLNLQTSGPAITNVIRHTEIINNPSDEFRRKLLKGGGILMSSLENSAEKSETKTPTMVGKPKLSGSDSKKHKNVESRTSNSFAELFGTPLKPTKVSQEIKKPVQQPEKSSTSKSLVTATEKSDKVERTKSKDSPHKDGKKEKVDEKDKKDKKIKDPSKDKNRSREKSKRPPSPGSKSHSSPSNKRPPSPPALPLKRPASPSLPPAKRPASPKSKEKELKKVCPEKEKDKNKEKDKARDGSKSVVDSSKSEKKKDKKKHKEDRDKERKDKYSKEGERSASKEAVKVPEKKSDKPEKQEKEKEKEKEREKGQEYRAAKSDGRKSPKPPREGEKPKEEKLLKVEKSEKCERSDGGKTRDGKSEKDRQKHKHKKRDKKEKRDSSKDRDKKEKRDRIKSSTEKQNNVPNVPASNPLSTLLAEMPERDSSDSAPSVDDDSFPETKLVPTCKKEVENLSVSTPPAEMAKPLSPAIPADIRKEKVDRNRKEKSKSGKGEEKETRKRKRRSDSKCDDEHVVKREKGRGHSTSPPLEPVSSSQSPVAVDQEAVHIKEKEDRGVTEQAIDKNVEPEAEQVAPDSTNSTLVESDMGEPPVFSEDYVSQLKDLQQKIMTLQDNQELQRVVQVIAETGQYEITKKTFDFDLCALDRRTVQRLQQFFAS